MELQHPEVRFEVTDHCNANCIMCPREKHTRPHGIMDTERYKASIDEIVSLGAQRVVLTGFGEPLLDKGLEEKVAYAASHGLKTYIITNASALTEKRAKGLLEAGLNEVRVSMYGMRAESYSTVMRGLNYKKTFDSLMGFLKIRATKPYKCKLHLSFLLLPENKNDIGRFKVFWENRADAIEVWKPHNFGDGRDYRDRTPEKRTCGRPENGPLQIQWNGEVIPCCYDYNNNIILGNAFEQPILDILHGEKYEALREQHRTGCYPEYCDQCDQLLPHEDALVYTNRHNLPNSEAVKLSNTDLYNLVDDKEIQVVNLTDNYK